MIDKDIMKYMKQGYFGSTDEPNDVEYVNQFFPKTKQPNLILDSGPFLYKHGNRITTINIKPYGSQTKAKALSTIQQTVPLPPTCK
jgi:hypothetical protein